ncbi:hypothetical protein JHK82_044374 [Glycine max]|nr:hypothetical protein JHK82_044374 [Glycine max]
MSCFSLGILRICGSYVDQSNRVQYKLQFRILRRKDLLLRSCRLLYREQILTKYLLDKDPPFQVGVRVDNFSCYASPSRKRQTNFITKLCQMIAFLFSLLERSYLERIFKYANCNPSCFVVAYVYLDRFTQRQPSLPINTFNVHRLLITSVMVAAKFMDDIPLQLIMRFAKILSSFTLLFIGYTLVNGSTPKHYIVYMGDHSHPNSESVIRANHEILASVTGRHALNDVLNSVSEYESVLSVFESKMNKLHTTHSWDFLGLETISKNNPKALDTASNVIVGEYLLKLNENC